MLECPNCHFENPENTKFCGNCATPLPISEETFDAPTETLEADLLFLRTGSVLSDRYEIIEEIGKGGMGKVFKVKDREINEKIALKLVRPEIASNKKIIERFRNEMKMARKITHKNVCRMFDIGRDGDRRYITMEHVSGEDLKKTIRRMGPLTIRKTLSISKQICHGLSEAHHLGIVHRDLKPHNIMIDREGNTKIMDFGIALSQDAQDITDSNVMIGTPQYLSPEQVEGKKADQRSDIYSLGVIMFEVVTGKVPFDGETTLSIAIKHKSEIPPDPKDFSTQIPEELNQLILKCLEKDPDRRYQTAEELCSAITVIEQKVPSTDTTISRSQNGIKGSRLIPKLTKAPGIFLLIALISIAGYFVFDLFLKPNIFKNQKIYDAEWSNSIAVLPFEDLSPDKDKNPLYLLVTDALIVNLHSFKEFRVIPTLSAQAYKNTTKNINTIGKELNVGHILLGNILRTGENVRIMVQLSSVETGSVIWGDIFTKKFEELEELHDEITKSVANALGVINVEERYIRKGIKVPVELADVYFRGRHYELSYGISHYERDFELCVDSYLKVVSANPNDALTYWRLGNIHEVEFNYGGRKKSILDLMVKYYHQAYTIDPDFAEANIGVGWSYYYKKDNDRAYEYMKKAYAIDPDNAEINYEIGSFFRSLGLYELALFHYSKAFGIDSKPLDFVVWSYVRAECMVFLKHHVEAERFLREALKIEPHTALYLLYARQLINLGRHEEAEVQIDMAATISKDPDQVRIHHVMLYAARGDKIGALNLIQKKDETYRYLITSIYALLGMNEEAIENINLGIKIGFEKNGSYIYSYPFLKNNSCYANLLGDPRFQETLKNQKDKYEEKISKYSDLRLMDKPN